MRCMNTKLFTLLLFGCSVLAPLPLAAQDEVDTPAESTEETTTKTPKKVDKKLAAALKKAQDAVKKQEKIKKDRAKVKIKWVSSDKKAFKEAAKYNLPVWVLYTDPATCPYCVKLDNEIILSKEFKKAKGLFIGYRSSTPLPEYGCSGGKPMGALFSPEKKNLGQLAYTPNQGPERYMEIIQQQADKLQEEAEKKAQQQLDEAKAAIEAAEESEAAE